MRQSVYLTEILSNLKIRWSRYFGHIMRGEKTLILIAQGKVKGKRGCGKPRKHGYKI